MTKLIGTKRTGISRRLWPLPVLGGCLLIVASLVLQQWASARLDQQLQERLYQHLLLSLDEAMFSDQASAANDRRSLHFVVQQINQNLRSLIEYRWFAVYRNCQLAITELDDITVTPAEQFRATIGFSLPLNQQSRQVVLGRHCELNPTPFLLLAVLVVALLGLLSWQLPQPLSRLKRQWMAELTKAGYSDSQAYRQLSTFADTALQLNACQQACFECLHHPEQHNAAELLALLHRPVFSKLDSAAIPWLLLGLGLENAGQPGDESQETTASNAKKKTKELCDGETEQQPLALKLERALALAQQADTVEIDLRQARLRIHGLDIPTTKTPLFYYALYAMEKRRGAGWLGNPASNRPDHKTGSRLAELMTEYGGHARAISDLEAQGLKAKTLDQNRSKIKEDIIAALGEELAAGYLFEGEKEPATGRMRYRLCCPATQIVLHS